MGILENLSLDDLVNSITCSFRGKLLVPLFLKSVSCCPLLNRSGLFEVSLLLKFLVLHLVEVELPLSIVKHVILGVIRCTWECTRATHELN